MSYSPSTSNTITGDGSNGGSGSSGELLLNGDLGFSVSVVGNIDPLNSPYAGGSANLFQPDNGFGQGNGGSFFVPTVFPSASSHGSSSGGSTGGGTVQTVVGTASAGLVIDIVYDSSVTSLATATKNALEGAVNTAVQYLESIFTNHTTITLDIGYGEIAGSAMASNALGESEAYWYTESYSQVKGILQAENAPGASTLPATSPFKGTIVTSLAQAQALGLASSGGTDGYIGISSAYPMDYTTATPASNAYYLVGILEHEMTEDMGRVSWLNYQPTYYSIADLYRYSSSGVRDLTTGGTGSTAYFSINNGATNFGTWNNQVSNGDLADWYPAGPAPGGYDAFNDYSNSGVVNAVSANDITLMEALGWTVAPAATGPAIISIAESPSTGDLSQGKTVTITLGLNETMTVTGAPTLTLNNGAMASYTSGSGSSSLVFTYAVGASDNNVSSLAVTAINLTGATIEDSGSNSLNPSVSGLTQTGPQIDTTTPAITSIAESPSTGDVGIGKTVTITLDFNEAVNVTGKPTLALNDGGTATYSSGSGSSALVFTYTVVAGNSNVSSLTVSSVDGGTIEDGAGNIATLSLPATQTGPLIDATVPVVSSVVAAPPSGVEGLGKTIAFTVTMSEAVTVTGTPTLTLSDGAVATYVSGSTTTALVFDYTVATGQYAQTLGITGVNLSGATIHDVAGNAAVLTGADTSFAGLTIDATIPVAPAVRAHDTLGGSLTAQPSVLASASDADTSDLLTVSAVDGTVGDVGKSVTGSYGSLTLNSDGSYSYANSNSTAVTAAGGVAVDIFSYTVSNGDGGTASSTLSVVITNSSETYIGGTSGVKLTGGTGSYVIDGGAGSDTLTAGKGAQVLIGGPGDTLTANTASGSSDMFVFASGFGKDTITNFSTSADKIQLSHAEFANFAAVQADAHQSSSHGTYTTTITYDANDIITLTGVQLSHLTSSDFIFA